MSGQERPAFVAGELVKVVVDQATMANPSPLGDDWVRVTIPDVAGEVVFDFPLRSSQVHVTRLAPAEWPPLYGDLWRDDAEHLWFAQTTAPRYGDDGRVFEGAKLLMAPAVESPGVYREQRYSPEDLLRQRGPLRLVHREPQPADDEDDV